MTSEPDSFSAHVEGPRSLVDQLPADATAEVALAWARERARVVLIRLDDESFYRSAGELPPRSELQMPQWPRGPGDPDPSASATWVVVVELVPAFGVLEYPGRKATADAQVIALGDKAGATVIDTNAGLDDPWPPIRDDGEEQGWATTVSGYRLTFNVQASGAGDGGDQVLPRIEVPSGWHAFLAICDRLEPLTSPPRPY